mmetsp:Transcript_99499/g.276893  ORF Transcript_99499/g.276893 Transcript_99499/m.276893 type:complete len:305 (+) Transcript_99499:241-1155(+)
MAKQQLQPCGASSTFKSSSKTCSRPPSAKASWALSTTTQRSRSSSMRCPCWLHLEVPWAAVSVQLVLQVQGQRPSPVGCRRHRTRAPLWRPSPPRRAPMALASGRSSSRQSSRRSWQGWSTTVSSSVWSSFGPLNPSVPRVRVRPPSCAPSCRRRSSAWSSGCPILWTGCSVRLPRRPGMTRRAPAAPWTPPSAAGLECLSRCLPRSAQEATQRSMRRRPGYWPRQRAPRARVRAAACRSWHCAMICSRRRSQLNWGGLHSARMACPLSRHVPLSQKPKRARCKTSKQHLMSRWERFMLRMQPV